MILQTVGVVAFSAALSWLATALLRPWLVTVALARPNARSSHAVPTPQGGGIAVVGAALATWAAALLGSGRTMAALGLTVLVACLALAAIGFRDDVRPVSARLRLLVQFACVAPVVALGVIAPAGPIDLPVLASVAILTVAGVWWVNLVNFMDGIDWITVSAMAPLCGALAAFGLLGHLSDMATLAAAALLGGLLGFAPANRPVAQLFLGDVGSLPIGLLTGWLLLELARSGSVAAALLLPLYYGTDATLTLVGRIRRGERLADAHRDHFYQRALRGGWTVLAIDARVFGLNMALALLAAATLAWPGTEVLVGAIVLGSALVAWTLRDFARPPRRVSLSGEP